MRETPNEATRAEADADAARVGLIGEGDYDPITGKYEAYKGMSVGAVVGLNVRRLREEKVLTQHELVQLWRRHGLNWARSKLSALESGARPSMSMGDLVIMAVSLRVPLAELLEGVGPVRLDPNEAELDRADMRRLMAGEVIDPEKLAVGPETVERQRTHQSQVPAELPVQADVELAQRLRVHPLEVVNTALGMFDNHTLTTERDRRVERMGAMSAQERTAHRGHITRELAELVTARLRRDGKLP